MLLHLCVFHIIVCQLKTQCGFDRVTVVLKARDLSIITRKLFLTVSKKV